MIYLIFLGIKGVVVYDPSFERGIKYTSSMEKYPVENQNEDQKSYIVSWSRSLGCYLNRQIIPLLSYLGISDQIFLELQKKAIEKLASNLTNDEAAKHFLALKEFKSFGSLTTEPFFRRLLLCKYKKQLSDIKLKSRLFVEEGKLLIGICDYSGTLEEDEVFVQLEKDNRIIEGRVGEFNFFF